MGCVAKVRSVSHIISGVLLLGLKLSVKHYLDNLYFTSVFQIRLSLSTTSRVFSQSQCPLSLPLFPQTVTRGEPGRSSQKVAVFTKWVTSVWLEDQGTMFYPCKLFGKAELCMCDTLALNCRCSKSQLLGAWDPCCISSHTCDIMIHIQGSAAGMTLALTMMSLKFRGKL